MRANVMEYFKQYGYAAVLEQFKKEQEGGSESREVKHDPQQEDRLSELAADEARENPERGIFTSYNRYEVLGSYEQSFVKLSEWIMSLNNHDHEEKAIQTQLKQILWPLFVHIYLTLLEKPGELRVAKLFWQRQLGPFIPEELSSSSKALRKQEIEELRQLEDDIKKSPIYLKYIQPAEARPIDGLNPNCVPVSSVAQQALFAFLAGFASGTRGGGFMLLKRLITSRLILSPTVSGGGPLRESVDKQSFLPGLPKEHCDAIESALKQLKKNQKAKANVAPDGDAHMEVEQPTIILTKDNYPNP